MERNYEPFFLTIGMLSGIFAFISFFFPYANIPRLSRYISGNVSGLTFLKELTTMEDMVCPFFFIVCPFYIAGVFFVTFGSIVFFIRYFSIIDGTKLLRIIYILGGSLLLGAYIFAFILIEMGGWRFGGSFRFGVWLSLLAILLAIITIIFSFFVKKESNKV